MRIEALRNDTGTLKLRVACLCVYVFADVKRLCVCFVTRSEAQSGSNMFMLADLKDSVCN